MKNKFIFFLLSCGDESQNNREIIPEPEINSDFDQNSNPNHNNPIKNPQQNKPGNPNARKVLKLNFGRELDTKEKFLDFLEIEEKKRNNGIIFYKFFFDNYFSSSQKNTENKNNKNKFEVEVYLEKKDKDEAINTVLDKDFLIKKIKPFSFYFYSLEEDSIYLGVFKYKEKEEEKFIVFGFINDGSGDFYQTNIHDINNLHNEVVWLTNTKYADYIFKNKNM